MRGPTYTALAALVLGAGCASSPLLSQPGPPTEATQRRMLSQMGETYPIGTRVLVHTLHDNHRTQVSGAVRQWNVDERELVLDNCVLHESVGGSSLPDWLRVTPGIESETAVPEMRIPIAQIRSIGRAAGDSLRRRALLAPGEKPREPDDATAAVAAQLNRVDRDRERRIRASAGPAMRESWQGAP